MRNFSTHFWKRFAENKDAVAFVEATPDGIEALTFVRWTRDVQRLAMGLFDAGFEPGQRMAIVAPGRREWLDVAFAVWLNGGVVVPLSPGRERGETLRCLARAGCEWIAADTHEALQAIRGQGDKLPDHLRWLAFEAMRVGSSPANTVELPELVETGRDLLKRGKLDRLAKRTYDIDRDAPAMVLYPLEPGEDPHGAFFGGGKLAVMLESLGGDLQLESDERVAPLLSFGWHYGSLVTLATLLQGRTVLSAPTPRELEDRFDELEPTMLLCGPAWIEGQTRQWSKRIEETPDFLKKVERTGEKFGLGKAISAVGSSVAKRTLYDPIRESLGDAVRRIYLAGGKIPDDVYEVLDGAQLPALGIWGVPEAGISHVERLGARKRGSVGRPVQGYVCRISDARAGQSGEVLIRSDVLFDGYWDDEGPRHVEEGYLRTGVRGRVESAYLFLD